MVLINMQNSKIKAGMPWSKLQWDTKISSCSIVQWKNSHSFKYNVWVLFLCKGAIQWSTVSETGFPYWIFLERAHDMATIGCGVYYLVKLFQTMVWRKIIFSHFTSVFQFPDPFEGTTWCLMVLINMQNSKIKAGMPWSKLQWDTKISICSIVHGNNYHSIKYNVWLLFFWKDATKWST